MSSPTGALPPGSKAKLTVITGLRKGKTYGVKEGGATYIGRKGPMQIDVDLTEQENPGVAVQVNRFALVYFDNKGIGIADTGTRIGTFVNGAKIASGKRVPLKAEDKIKFGKVELQVKVIIKKKTGTQK